MNCDSYLNEMQQSVEEILKARSPSRNQWFDEEWKDIEILDRFERRIRREKGTNILQKKKECTEICGMCDDVGVVSYIEIGKLRWLGRVDRMKDNNPRKKILESNIYGGRPKGKP